jgi:hypothetical protein
MNVRYQVTKRDATVGGTSAYNGVNSTVEGKTLRMNRPVYANSAQKRNEYLECQVSHSNQSDSVLTRVVKPEPEGRDYPYLLDFENNQIMNKIFPSFIALIHK